MWEIIPSDAGALFILAHGLWILYFFNHSMLGFPATSVFKDRNMDINTLWTAIAIAFILEGIAPALFPNKWQAYVQRLANEPTSTIRNIGFSILGCGLLILWLLS